MATRHWRRARRRIAGACSATCGPPAYKITQSERLEKKTSGGVRFDGSAAGLRAAGLPHDQLAIEENIPCRQVRSGDAFKHRGERRVANLPRRLSQRGQRYRQQFRVLEIVYPDDANSVWNLAAEPKQRRYEARCGAIVGTHDRIGRLRSQDRLNRGCIRWIETMNERALDWPVPRVERFTVSRFTRIDRRGGARHRHECDAPRFEPKHMLCDHVAGAAIVDSHQIVMPASRVGHHRAIQQDDWNLRLVQRARNALVDIV